MIDPDRLREIVAAIPLNEGCVAEPQKANPFVAAIVAGMDLTPRKELTQERLKELLDYNPDTGIFRYKVRVANCVQIGDIAGSVRRLAKYDKYTNYVFLHIDGKVYSAHRLIWLYVHGRFPDGELDHIDRDETNNRLSNLVETNKSVQQFNSRLPRNNTSGHRGVTWNSYYRKWHVRIGSGGKGHRWIGEFRSIEDAIAARQAAEIKLLGCLTEELKDPRNRRPRFKRRI